MIASRFLRRLVAVALPLLLLAALYGAIIHPAARFIADRRATVHQLADTLARYRQRADRLPALTTRLAALRANDKSANGFLTEDNEALAAGALQEHLKMLVEQWHGRLVSIQIIPAQAGEKAPDEKKSDEKRPDDKRRSITARGEMTVNIAGLERVLYAVETESPFLFVDNLSVHAVRTAGKEAAQSEPSLDVRFDFVGFMRGTG